LIKKATTTTKITCQSQLEDWIEYAGPKMAANRSKGAGYTNCKDYLT